MVCRDARGNSLYLAVAAVVLLVVLIGTAADATTRIVPIGDSITKGMINTDDGGNHPTYRYWLYNSLRSNGNNFDFVGSWSEPELPVRLVRPAERGARGVHHRRNPERGVKDDPSHLSDWLPRYSAPNVALILLGTNDVLAQVPRRTRFSNMNGHRPDPPEPEPEHQDLHREDPADGRQLPQPELGAVRVQRPSPRVCQQLEYGSVAGHGRGLLQRVQRHRAQPGAAVHPPERRGRTADRQPVLQCHRKLRRVREHGDAGAHADADVQLCDLGTQDDR